MLFLTSCDILIWMNIKEPSFFGRAFGISPYGVVWKALLFLVERGTIKIKTICNIIIGIRKLGGKDEFIRSGN